MTRIFLSYARGDDEAFVRRLYDDLRANGFEVWYDRFSMPSRQLKFLQEIRDAIARHDRLLLIVGPKAVTTDYVRQEWQSAFRMDKCINPIVRLDYSGTDGSVGDGYTLIPDQLKLLHAEDFRNDDTYAEHLANLIRQLSDPIPPLGKLIGVPTLPLHYIAQPDRLLTLRSALLTELEGPLVLTGVAARVGVQGMGGIGKSVLAAAVAQDIEVRRAFPDGIYWLSVRQEPNLLELQRTLAKHLGDQALFDEINAGKQKLKELLAERAVLIILDDVWRSTDANAFDIIGVRCKMLLTTRDAALVSTMAGTGYEVQLPRPAEAQALLANAARKSIHSLPPLANEVIEACGKLPLALALCGGMVQAGIPWQDLLESLHEHELEFITDHQVLEENHQSLWRALEASILFLSEDKRRRFAELAVFRFQQGSNVPESIVLSLWEHTGGLSKRQVRRLLVELKQRSLVQLDSIAGVAGDVQTDVSLHDLLRHLALRLAYQLFGSFTELHQHVLDAYRKQCPQGWPTGPDDLYFFPNLRHHLIGGGRGDELVSTVLDIFWLESKAKHGYVFDLLLDFVTAIDHLPADDPKRQMLGMVDEAIRRNVHFIERYPTTLFQCLWNLCWWYDCKGIEAYYKSLHLERFLGENELADHSWTGLAGDEKLSDLLEHWRHLKEQQSPNFIWIRSLRPPYRRLGAPRVKVLQGTEGAVLSISYSADGRTLVSVGNGILRLWDRESGAQIELLNFQSWLPRCVAYSPNGREAALGGADGTVRFFDVSTWIQRRSLRAHPDFVNNIAYSFDGKRLVSGGGFTVSVWDTETGENINNITASDGPINRQVVSISPDGRLITGHGGLFELCVYDAEAGQLLRRLRLGIGIRSVVFSPDGRMLLTNGYDGAILWDVFAGTKLKEFWHSTRVVAVCFSPDGKNIVTGSEDGILRLWDVATGKGIRRFRAHTGAVQSVAYSPDGLQIASGANDHNIVLWNPQDLHFDVWKRIGDGDSPSCIRFSPNGKHVVTGFVDYEPIQTWETESGRLLDHQFENDRGSALAIDFSPDGHRILGQNWTKIRVWDFNNGRVLLSINNDKVLRDGRVFEISSVEYLRYSPHGTCIVGAVRGWDHNSDDLEGWVDIVIWNAADGTELLRIPNCDETLSHIAWFPDGKRIVGTFRKGLIRVWDATTGVGLLDIKSDLEIEAVTCPRTAPLILGKSTRYSRTTLWNSETGRKIGSQHKAIDGDLDVEAAAANLPVLAAHAGSETVIYDARSLKAIAWFPESLTDITSHTDGKTWAGIAGDHLQIIRLEVN